MIQLPKGIRLCRQIYESLYSMSLLSYHISPELLASTPLPSFLGDPAPLLSGLFPFLEERPSSSGYRHGTQKRSDSDSKVGECFIGVAGSYYDLKKWEI